MLELTPTKQRTLETVEALVNQLPPTQKMMVTAFMPQCRHLLINIEDENIIDILNLIRAKLDYIEGGEI